MHTEGRMKRSLLTIEEAAGLVGVSTSTIRRWQADGRLDGLVVEGSRRVFFLDLDVYRAERDARPANGESLQARQNRARVCS